MTNTVVLCLNLTRSFMATTREHVRTRYAARIGRNNNNGGEDTVEGERCLSLPSPPPSYIWNGGGDACDKGVQWRVP